MEGLAAAITAHDVDALVNALEHFNTVAVTKYFYAVSQVLGWSVTALGHAIALYRRKLAPDMTIISTLLRWGVDPCHYAAEPPDAQTPLNLMVVNRVPCFAELALLFRYGVNPGRDLWHANNRSHDRPDRFVYVRRHSDRWDTTCKLIQPYAWRQWHCSLAATALIGVRRHAARGVMRVVPRDVMRLVDGAVLDMIYAEEWEI